MGLLDFMSQNIAQKATGSKQSSSATNKKKGKSSKGATRSAIQKTMQYDEAYFNGMIRKGREYSICYEIPNVTFRGISEEKQKEVMEQYVALLNSFDSYLKITLVIANIRESGDISREVRYPADTYPEYAEELNRIFRDKFSTHNSVATYRLFVIRGSFDNPVDADNQFSVITNSLDDIFTQAWQLRGSTLSIGKRLHLIASIVKKDFYNPYLAYDAESDEFTVDIDLLKSQGLTIDNIICPQHLKFNMKDFEVNDRIGRSYYLSKIGNSVSTDFLFSIYNIDAEMVLAVDMNGVESGDALRKLNNKYSQILAEVEDKDGFQTLEQVSEQESILDMQDAILNHDEKSYNASIMLTLFAEDKEELAGLQQQVYAKAKRHTCGFEPVFASQNYGFMSCCLLGFYDIEFKRFFNAHNLGAFIPFDVPEYFDGDGIYYGLHRINNLPIFYDRNKNDNYNALVLGRSGCVDRETEFFNGKEWKSIADYVEGEQVLQYDVETGEASLTYPKAYIKKPCNEMYHFETESGLDQTLSAEHRVLYYMRDEESTNLTPAVEAMEELYKKQKQSAFHGKIRTTFSYNGPGIDLSEDKIRQAFIVGKDQKLSIVSLDREIWYQCNTRQLQLVCNHLLSQGDAVDCEGKQSYMVFNPETPEAADFIQFAFSACGYRAVRAEGCLVYIYADTFVDFSDKKRQTKIEKVVPSDGYKYCFTVPTSFLVLRRNGKVFTTGNSGKSFFVKREILLTRLRYPKDHIYIIDPDGEYTFITKQLGGEVIDLRPGNGIYLNPMDLDIDNSANKEENPIVAKSDMIASLVETMMGGGIILNSKSKSILDRCVRRVYQPYLDHLNLLAPDGSGKRVTIDRNACPTLQDVYDELMNQQEIEAQEMAVSIETYITGSFDTFAHRTNIDTTNTFIDFNIQGLGQNMLNLGLNVCLSEMRNRMIANRAKNIWTRMYIDEFHNLLSTELSADFCKKLWKQARKWMGAPTGITQNTEDLLSSQAARAIINNSGLVILLNQSELDQEVLGQILHLDDTDLRYVNKVKPGCGLIVTNSLVIPFYDDFPKNTKCYKLLDTSPDKKEREKEGAA